MHRPACTIPYPRQNGVERADVNNMFLERELLERKAQVGIMIVKHYSSLTLT
jgi:hypothetical protein